MSRPTRILAAGLALALAAAARPVHAAAPAPDSLRDVLVLTSPAEGGVPIGEGPMTAVESVLNHLGLTVTYHDVAAGLPDAELSARLRGVVSLVTGADVPDPRALAGWLRARQEASRPVLLLGGAGFLQEAADGSAIPAEVWAPVLAGIGVQDGGPQSGPAGEGGLAWQPGGWAAFEAPRMGIPPYLNTVRRLDPAAEAPLRVRAGEAEGDAVVVGPRGAYAADRSLLLEQNPLTFRLRWRLDPYKLLSRALGTDGLPRLDPTTINGRRTFFAHIDGDGFRNMSIEPTPRRAAEVVRDEVLARTWLPTTVSIIAGEVAGNRSHEALARSIFRLPQVEPAVHSWSHPHDWERGLLSPPGSTVDSGDEEGGKAVKLDPRKEVDQAIAYVQGLLPPGKHTAAMLWSGRTNLTPRFLARTDAIGVPNMNGGDALLQPGAPSVAAISPFARRVGTHLQVLAASANENLYTNLWNGPFDGQRRALDYYRFSGSPRRLAAVNIYYHFYAAERRAGLRVLRDLYTWCERQPFAPVTASTYARIVQGFDAGRLRSDDGATWVISGAGACRSVRFDGEARRVDLDASEGVAGWLAGGDRLWVHLSAPDARIVLAAAPPDRPRLQEASAPLADWKREARAISARFDAAAPAKVVLAGLPPGQPVRLQGDFTGPGRIDAAGKLALVAAPGRRRLEVRW